MPSQGLALVACAPMRAATSRRAREVTGAQSEYHMVLLLLVACFVVVALFAGTALQLTASSVSNHLAHVTDHDYQVTTHNLLP